MKYSGQEATCHLCGKTGHKSAECEEKEERQKWPKLQKQKPEKNLAKSSPDLNSHVQSATPDVLCTEKVQNKKSLTPNKDWFDVLEEETTSRPLRERVTEARKRQRSEAESHENSECEESETKLIKSCIQLQCSFCNKIGQWDPQAKHYTCMNCKCEQEINNVCCNGKIKLIPHGFHSHRCLDCNTMLDRCDVCEKYVKVSSINGIVNKCETYNSVLVKCDC